jgi:hypothetical protein
VDVTELILSDHHEQRRMFAQLDDLPPDDTRTLTAVWSRLKVLLEVHAKAEELFFYPALLRHGTGGEDEDGPQDETEDAIKDHNEIRDGIRQAGEHPVGSDAWWAAVRSTRTANSDHMAEEEREDLADFRRNGSLQTRHDIAVRFARFEATHAEGVPAEDLDPAEYVREQS